MHIHTGHQRQCLDSGTSVPTMNASVISATGTNDPKNALKATKGNDDAREEDATARAGSGEMPGRVGGEGTERSKVPPLPCTKQILTITSTCNRPIQCHIVKGSMLRERPRAPPN